MDPSVESYELCRLCGVLSESTTLGSSLNAECGKLKFKHFIEYYCRFELSDNPCLPQRVCYSCIKQLQDFISFSNSIEVYQNILNATSWDVNKYTESTASFETSTSDYASNENMSDIFEESFSNNESLLVAVETPEKKRNATPKKKKIHPLTRRFAYLFKKELKQPHLALPKLDVPESEVASDGEVSLPDAKCWKDLMFSCTHCKVKYESLDNLLKHFRADVPLKGGWKLRHIKCPDCWGLFLRPQFLNHVQQHHSNLMYSCITCSKVFHNLAWLLKHYVEHHPDNSQADIYFCVHCGIYFTNFEKLKLHILTHSVNARQLSRSPQKLRGARSVERSPSKAKEIRPMDAKTPGKKRGRRPKSPTETEEVAEAPAMRRCVNGVATGSQAMEETKEKEELPKEIVEEPPIFVKPCPKSKKEVPAKDSRKPCPLSKKPQAIATTEAIFLSLFKFTDLKDPLMEVEGDDAAADDIPSAFPEIGREVMKRRLKEL